MSELYDGSIEVSIGYSPDDLDSIKGQAEDDLGIVIFHEKEMRLLSNAMIEGLTSAGIWLANKASKDAPWLTRRLQQSGSVWVESKRVYITGGGTHPDQVDTGDTTAIIIFNTPYAFMQDTEAGYRHPRGGRSGYLTANLEENHKIIEAIMFAPVEEVIKSMLSK